LIGKIIKNLKNSKISYINLGFLSKLETQLIIGEKLGYIGDLNVISEKVEILRRKVLNFTKYLKNRTAHE